MVRPKTRSISNWHCNFLRRQLSREGLSRDNCHNRSLTVTARKRRQARIALKALLRNSTESSTKRTLQCYIMKVIHQSSTSEQTLRRLFDATGHIAAASG